MSVVGNDNQVYANELNYKMQPFLYPQYQNSRILPLSGGQTVTLTATSGNQEALFEIPTKCHNLSQSILKWNTTIAAQGNAPNYSWVQANTYGEVNAIELYSRSGQYLARIDDLNVILNLIRPKETAFSEFLTNTEEDALYPCNKLANVNYLPVAALGAVTAASKNYTEMAYLTVSADNTAQTLYREMKLGCILNSYFAMNKDMIFPEVLILRVVFNGSRVGWMGTSNNNPTTGAAVLAGNIAIANLQLLLAVEQNQNIINELQAKVASGLNLSIPYLYRYKNSPTAGTSQNVSIRLNRGHGKVVKKIIHSIYNNTEAASNTMYDHSNIGANANTALKVTTYYTQLDNLRLQQYNLNATLNTGDDHLENKKFIKGSALLDQQIYSYGWFHQDDFSHDGSPEDKAKMAVNQENLISGLSLDVERKWDFIGDTMINAQYNHYTVVCTEKDLMVSPTQIMVI
jgi:hypothetical protein